MDQEFCLSEQRLRRLEYLREIKNIMGIYSGLYLLKREGEIYNTLWSTREDICLGINEGYYIGAQSVSAYYNALSAECDYKSSYLIKQFAEQAAQVSEEARQGFGLIDYRPMDTFVIEIAEDNQTAKGMWYCRGSYVDVTEKGPLSRWVWGYYLVDFVLENGSWKIWHLKDLKDADNFCGTAWTDQDVQLPNLDEFCGAENFTLPAPDVPCVLHERYHSFRRWTPAPRMPEPYDTFANTFSYGADTREGII